MSQINWGWGRQRRAAKNSRKAGRRIDYRTYGRELSKVSFGHIFGHISLVWGSVDFH